MTVRLATLSDVPALRAAVRAAPRVAMDTEFHAEHRWLPELYLVQIQIPGGDTWIVDPLVGGLLTGIADALRETPWLVHGGEQDLRVLGPALGGLPGEILDTQIAAGLVDTWWPAPYQALVRRWLGQRVEKAETLSDWSRRPLRPSQVTYAALDVQLLPPLWEAIDRVLVESGRDAIARTACAEARRRAIEPPSDHEAFRSILAAPSLEPQQLAVLQELAAWREQRGRATNQPPRTILGDAALVELARRQPLTVESLVSNRRIPRAAARSAPELVERIARAARRPEEAFPPFVRRRTREARVSEWLQLLATAIGERERIAPGLALPRHLSDSLALVPPRSRAELSDRLGWRDALVGSALWDALGGDTSIRLADGDVILERAPRPGSRDPG